MKQQNQKKCYYFHESVMKMFSKSNRKDNAYKTPTNCHGLIYLESFEKYISAENILKTMSHQPICNIYSPIRYPTLHKNGIIFKYTRTSNAIMCVTRLQIYSHSGLNNIL
jgi:hypothetical protein